MFEYVATVIFALLFLVWHRKDWLNFSIKVAFFALMVWGAVESGFVVKL